MRNLIKTFIVVIAICIIFSACYESEPIIIGGKTRIFKLQDTITFYSDTLTLYGENLGKATNLSYIVINDIDTIKSDNCINWTQSKIQFVVPSLPLKSTIYVVVADKKIYYDAQNYYQNLIVLPYPAFDYVLIPVGSFDMGSDEFGIPNEQPIHNVMLTKDIYVSTCEVNQRLYSLIMQENPSTIKYNNYPVYNVSWLDAIRFCNKLSLLDGLKPVYEIINSTNYVSFDIDANGWRLPTEAEWEYFADISVDNEKQLLEYAWFYTNSTLNPHSVGKLKANKYSLYDILGNVWEWCWDYYREDYYSISPLVNPTGPTESIGAGRVIRGGSCDDGKILVRKEYRTTNKSNEKIGFRIVKNSG